MEIRGKTIAYTSYKKKMESNNENVLLEEIDRLEKAKEMDHKMFDEKRNDLQEIRNKKWNGLKYDQE